jgi:hypothetical protein
MRTFWLNFIVVVMTVASFQFIEQVNFSNFSADEIESLSAIDGWGLSSLKEADCKTNLNHSYIAQNFIPIVTLAQTEITSIDFDHYLPVHNLIGEKDYFLLI